MNAIRFSSGPLVVLLLALFTCPSARAQTASDIPWSSIKPTRPSVAPPVITDSTLSFYKRKAEWGEIIDEYWGQGTTLQEKQSIFNSYANYIQRYFTAFEGLGISWDSLRAHYYPQISDSTSHGRFSAILSYLAYHLREPHATVLDYSIMSEVVGDTVVLADPSWGKPVWFKPPMPTASHFGAVLTPRADSSALVIRAIPNHPLGLKPGDVVLGYEGVPWRQIARELLAAEVPSFSLVGGSRTMETHHLLQSAGSNWHLFDTIDIVTYPSGDTLHLPVDTLASIRMIDSIYNNESLEVPGVPWPDWNFTEVVPNTKPVSHGIVEGTNIGYIYVALHTSTTPPWSNPSPDSEERFYQAVTELWGTDGLIIDLRHDRGGRTLSNFNSAFRKLLNFDTHTLDYYWRASGSNLTALVPYTPPLGAGRMYIDADEETVYDRPIAVLVGPGCVSVGDVTAYRLTYFPNTRFFGKPTSMGWGGANWTGQAPQVPGYVLVASDIMLRDHYDPGRDLERMEFPVDELVWLTQEDVANGDDTVVKRALGWITGVAHAHDVMASSRFVAPADTLQLTAVVEDPNGHQLAVTAFYMLDSMAVDSSLFYDDGVSGDGIWGTAWLPPAGGESYSVTVVTEDSAHGTEYTMPYSARFTTVGPLVLDQSSIRLFPDTVYWGDRYLFWFNLRNLGTLGVAKDISLKLESDLSCVMPPESPAPFGDIQPNDTSALATPISVVFHPTCLGTTQTATIAAHIMSQGYEYWSDSFSVVVTAVEPLVAGIPEEFALHQNYPNPFNPVTTIRYELPERTHVVLKVFNVLGEEVATLVDGREEAGYRSVEFKAANLASGMYIYRLQAEGFVQTRKMLVVR